MTQIGTELADNSEHAELGGSGSDRWGNCSGSVFLYRTLPPQTVVHERTTKGSHAHALADMAVRSMLHKKLTGEGLEGVAETILSEPDDEIANAVVRYCELIWTNVLKEYITGKAYGAEEKFILHTGMDMWGTTDFWCVYPDDRAKRVLAIVDFKFGYHEVDIKSLQFPFYACAAREEFLEAGKDIDYARCIVIQPPMGEEKDYKEIKYTAKQLDSIKKKFFKQGHQIYEKQKPRFKTGKWCKYCRAQAICPKYQTELGAGSGLGPVADIKLPEVQSLSDEAIAKIIKHRKPLEAFLKACSAYGITRHLSGDPLPGMKVVEGVRKRTWLEDQTQVADELLSLGLQEQDLFTKKLIGIGKVETLLKEGGVKAKEAKELLEPVTYKKPAALSLVPVEDPRPAVEAVGDSLGAITEEIEEE